jgi:hypothetical protein
LPFWITWRKKGHYISLRVIFGKWSRITIRNYYMLNISIGKKMYCKMDQTGRRKYQIFPFYGKKIIYKSNSIISLITEDGRTVRKHDEMAAIAWNCYLKRMGTQRGIDMCLDLQNLLHIVEGLDALTVPFTHEKMDKIISKMPPDKAPGPDGFNGSFLKKMSAYY